ncbi:K(+)-transporting ATPase subunit F [Cohnella rhizosphaerae]|uniref:K(+)-transporting ATPase subunit F n=1 Tax=Cohnella rhizosphaerae TaxID=1457232 RepID=A0A9X4KSG1_9BACL|nr:K(+)-transporting ATPase subunit F [Cohnella rhizosphaerae]MDG0809868.1 K(+)-transporting ATPase subunit F [Cohnella rhizosphaerae]
MMDVWMTIALLAAFALVVGFVYWCDRSIDEAGGRGRMTIVLVFTGLLLIYLVYALLHPEKF